MGELILHLLKMNELGKKMTAVEKKREKKKKINHILSFFLTYIQDKNQICLNKNVWNFFREKGERENGKQRR